MISIKTIAVLKGLELRIEEPCDLVHRGFLGFFQERLVKDYTELTWSVTDWFRALMVYTVLMGK